MRPVWTMLLRALEASEFSPGSSPDRPRRSGHNPRVTTDATCGPHAPRCVNPLRRSSAVTQPQAADLPSQFRLVARHFGRLTHEPQTLPSDSHQPVRGMRVAPVADVIQDEVVGADFKVQRSGSVALTVRRPNRYSAPRQSRA
jgi:hypothetical protein